MQLQLTRGELGEIQDVADESEQMLAAPKAHHMVGA
jgi:hypothetical protein